MYCPVCYSILKYSIEDEQFKCQMTNCPFKTTYDFSEDSNNVLFSKINKFDFLSSSSLYLTKKFIDDKTIYSWEKCNKCKTDKQIIIMGSDNPVVENCQC